ncbi:unnamed protein product [Alopecurus aequalis]
MEDKGKNLLDTCPQTDRSENIQLKKYWVPPHVGTVKINVDAAFVSESGASAVGVMARDHRGVVIAAMCRIIGNCRDAEEAETVAILTGMQLGIDLDMHVSILESDCAAAVKAVNCSGVNLSETWSLFKEIGKAKTRLPDCVVSFTRRNLNSAAHELARIALRSGDNNFV